MAAFTGDGKTAASITNAVQIQLGALRTALERCQDIYRWTSGLGLPDLEAIGFTASDAQDILSAVADANSLAVLYYGGTFGGSLPYNFSASQAAVLGPL